MIDFWLDFDININVKISIEISSMNIPAERRGMSAFHRVADVGDDDAEGPFRARSRPQSRYPMSADLVQGQPIAPTLP